MESKSSLWDEEYQRQNIASSFKGTLSHSVKFLLGSFGEFSPKSFLDLGCGNGRNTIPLARMGYEVTGVDISQVALNQAGEKLESESAGVQKRVQLIPSSMGQPFPFEDKTFDVVMDITSFDILINDTEIDCHKKEVARVLKNNGYFLYYDMAEDDPYSLALLAKSPDKSKGIIYTPAGIPFKIYSADDITRIFSPFKVITQEKFRFQDKMDGVQWNRSILCVVMKNHK
ncbi:MAG: hypothetical protein A2654_02450 [Candidatus Nealsonbacteria bacterium RIFCSPHIGHO2_01_FULL_43_31]|uniref:Methyltransferase domain-containing protein n=1 Tax=Candidatus Nealsonbacteria bacterium RIFCSPHIGHO2_01_FULL_43_31 TaxID=1801665 RepID=A0A1G2E192_9BACT|nr:MAG: hypothetical protein A2654_02450 [Candidatus Nealsonbacteria bacterium RIFCSPHIGHO2_01_FULL_43_31]